MPLPFNRMTVTAWPAGQGLFGQVDLRVGEADFCLVYDCGTETGHYNPLEFPRNEITNRHIDLLVISHFHEDHVSHIPSLLQMSSEVGEVWIPYVAPKERVLYLALLAAADPGPSLISLVANPARWLREDQGLSVKEIGRPPGDIDSSHERRRKSENRLMLHPRGPAAELFPEGSNVTAERAELTDVRGAVYEITTWTRPRPEDELDGFAKSLQALLRSNDAAAADAFSTLWQHAQESEVLASDEATNLVRALTNKAIRGQVRSAYAKLKGKLNATSLFLMGQPKPLTQSQSPWWLACGPCWHPGWDCCSGHHHLLLPSCRCCGVYSLSPAQADKLLSTDQLIWRVPGWKSSMPAMLWCGDASATELIRVIGSRDCGISGKLAETAVVQIPHHGAKESFSKRFNDMLQPALAFISCGIGNRHHHPDWEVVQQTRSIIVDQTPPPLRITFLWKDA